MAIIIVKVMDRICILLFLVVSVDKGNTENYLESRYPETILEDALLDTAQLITKYGYPIETHFITTEDNYVLCMHRIPKSGGRPVLLMHGLMDSSATWVVMGPWSGLGYFLFDHGYDVWLGNVRGNRYSRNHSIYNPERDRSFWKFSWHEIGFYDLPAFIDFILGKTGFSKLAYFGHSQGTTSFWVLGSMRPSYNDKISIMTALAPVAFCKNARTQFLGVLRNFIGISGDMITEFMPHNDLLIKFCFRSKITEDTCMETFWQIMGKDTKQLNTTMQPVIYGHIPAGCNIKQWAHYIQVADSNRFCQFDHGAKENKKRYGQLLPPDYPLEKIRAPVGLHYAYNDYLSSVIDVQRLVKYLPNVVDDNLLPHRKWNHVSMLWGISARRLAHQRMLDRLREYE